MDNPIKFATWLLATLTFLLVPHFATIQAQAQSTSGQFRQGAQQNYMPRTQRISSVPARETAVDRIVIPVFTANTPNGQLNALWNQRRVSFQNQFVRMMNEQSYLDAIAVPDEYDLGDKGKVIVDEARESGVDGVLVGEFRGNSIEVALKSGASGRTLEKWTVPIGPLGEQSEKEAIKSLTGSIVVSFPYRGLVVGVKGNYVKLNLGSKQGVNVGTKLEIFEFSGVRPTLSSPHVSLGVLEIIKINPTEAIGFVKKVSRPISPYSKVSFVQLTDDVSLLLRTRTHPRMWLSAALEYNYTDTQISDDQSTALRKRLYQIPMSPAIAMGFGYSKLTLTASASSASNDSNKVSFLSGTGSYEFLYFHEDRMSLITSVGFSYSKYTATPTATATLPLNSATTMAPYIEEHIQYISSSKTKIFGAGQLYYPVMSSDDANGSSVAFKSFGMGLLGGLRLDLSKMFALDGGLQLRYLRMGFETSQELAEIRYGFFTRLIVKF